MLANWRLAALTGDSKYGEIAERCSATMLDRQQPDGTWEYPNPEWKGRVTTAEGVWGSLGLLESYRQTGDSHYMDGIMKWYRFMTDTIGYQQIGDELAVNYFAYRKGARIPNNSAFVLRFLAELADVTGDASYLDQCDGLINFTRSVQKPSGEFPYAVEGVDGGAYKSHFQCYQYNAFQCLDLMRYHELTQDEAALPLIGDALDFLRRGIGENGHVYYECGNPHRTTTYHTAVVAAAFCKAGLDYTAARAYRYVLALQRRDGSFPHSRGDYRLLSDERAYPRYLAMILLHLLQTQPEFQDEPYTNKEMTRVRTRVR